MRYCTPIPFRGTELFCYPEVFLSYYDKLFIVLIVAALVATLVGYLEGRVR